MTDNKCGSRLMLGTKMAKERCCDSLGIEEASDFRVADHSVGRAIGNPCRGNRLLLALYEPMWLRSYEV